MARASSALYVYEPGTNTWTRKQDMPSVLSSSGKRQYGGAWGVTGVIAGQLYVLTSCYQEEQPIYNDCTPALFFR